MSKFYSLFDWNHIHTKEEQLYNVYIYQEDEKKKLKMKMRK